MTLLQHIKRPLIGAASGIVFGIVYITLMNLIDKTGGWYITEMDHEFSQFPPNPNNNFTLQLVVIIVSWILLGIIWAYAAKVLEKNDLGLLLATATHFAIVIPALFIIGEFGLSWFMQGYIYIMLTPLLWLIIYLLTLLSLRFRKTTK